MPFTPTHILAVESSPIDTLANGKPRRWRPRVRLRGAMLGIASVAVCLKWPLLIMPVLLVLGAQLLGRAFGSGKSRVGWMILLAVYGPMLLGLVWQEGPFRTMWIWILPIWPGVIVVVLCAWLGLLMESGDVGVYVVAATATLALLGGAAWLAGRHRAWFVAIVVTCLVASSAMAFIVAQPVEW